MKIADTNKTGWRAGVARQIITPNPNVELAGLGYYLKRTPQRVRDDLTATSLVISDSLGNSAVFVALDILYADEDFVRRLREEVGEKTGIPAHAICVNCSHSHNAPTMAFVRGLGERDPQYVEFVRQRAVDSVIQAAASQHSVRLSIGQAEVNTVSFNRTREGGPIDNQLRVLRVDHIDGKPLAVAINFHCHLNAHLDRDFHAVSRDWSGEVIDQIESAKSGVTAFYLQGTCGDVMVRPEFCSTDRSSEVANQIAAKVSEACKTARTISPESIRTSTRRIILPTRRWTDDEVMQVRGESLHRFKTGDTRHWLTGFARAIVTYPDRLPRRYEGSVEKAVAAVSRFGVEWSDETLKVLHTRTETIEAEVQAIRIGNVWFAAHPSELYTTLGLAVRTGWHSPDLFMLGYSNGSIGYLPDAHDIQRRTYAAEQSPKFTGQFPFTAKSGVVMVEEMLKALADAS